MLKAKENFIEHGFSFKAGEEIPPTHAAYGIILKYRGDVTTQVEEPEPKPEAKKETKK